MKAGWFYPLLHVQSIERSIDFYKLLGFELINTDGCRPHLGWARMHCEGGALMFLRAEEEVIPEKQGVIFAMYTPDLAAFRSHLLASGVMVPEITYPEYMPSGSLFFRDPDGYGLGVHHWGKKEHDEWLKRIGRTAV